MAVKRPSGDGTSIGIAVGPAAPPAERRSAADWRPLRDISVAPVARGRRGWVVRRMLLAADIFALAGAVIVIELGFRGDRLFGHIGVAGEIVVFAAIVLPIWVVAAKLYGLYDRDEERASHSTVDEVVSVFNLVTAGVWLLYAAVWLAGLRHPSQAKLVLFWLVALTAVIVARSGARALARRQPAYLQNALIVGAGDVGQLVGRKLLQHPEYRIRLLGFVDAEPKEMRRDLGDVTIVGTPDEIDEIVRREQIDRVIVAFSRGGHEDMLELMRAIRKLDVQVDVVPRLFEAVGANVGVRTLEGLPLLGLPTMKMSRSSRFLKRGLDLAGASILLVLTAPLLALIAMAVRRDSSGPIFFRQTRLGMDAREFTLLKFRTMHDGTDDAPHREYISQIMSSDALPTSNNLYKLERPEAVTRLGRWLRRTSLDELPQLLNVLRGDMSLVGPRPSIPYELELFAPHHFERFLVPAGLTGLWQVEARAHATFGEALDLDVAYVRGWSFGLDLRLLLATPRLIFRKRDTS